eukprot:CAMPEP_0113292860 /NCGR_PEP_ID=MMETSP0008_2-20120614/34939_1 /TAXON_ID=97485 /ORGANISM="Prymnesium parvum" /LENGTH=40 /DNA_ID=CAMNT_0000145131 /DNA_START=52 /DNA_END=171 /DNA_ORIENTATION=+ /assembly_acc=CAM_ASM_000153
MGDHNDAHAAGKKGWETTTMRMLREGASKETTSAADSDLP